MNITSKKIDSKTYRIVVMHAEGGGGDGYTIKKITKWTWKVFDEQGIAIKGMSGPSAVKVETKLEAWLTERDAIPTETPEEFEAKGGKVTTCKPQPNGRVKPEGPRSAEKNRYKLAQLKKGKGKKARRKKKATGDTQPKSNRIRAQEDVVTLQEILEEFGMAGTKARKILRASAIEKPGKQWVWEKGSKQLTKVRDALGLAAGITKAITKSGRKK